MNKRFSLKVLLLLSLSVIFVASVVALAACNEAVDVNEFVEGQGNTVQVLLDSLKSGVLDYRLKPGSPIPEPGKTPNTTAPVAEGFIFEGYYEGTMNDDGTVTYGEKWDFSRKVTEPITLYGKWAIQYKLRINYVKDGKLQNQSELVNIIGNAATVTSIKDPSWSGNTFIQMFADKQCEQPLEVSTDQPFEHGCTQENPICDIYAQFMEGRWTLVRTASDLRNINSGSNLYFMADIDMTSYADEDGYTDITVASDFQGTIEGNGYKIINLHYFREGKDILPIDYTSYCIGLFAQVNNATIRNITFENCTVGGSIRAQNGEYMYGFIAGRAVGQCTFENITFVGCELQELQFNILTLNAEDNEAERKNLDQKFFIGYGSSYTPNIVEQSIASLTNLVIDK